MKVLYYNWCPLDNGQSGGIGVYQNNLLKNLEISEEIDAYFVCSGFFYDNSKKIHWKKERSNYSIINSPVIAPMRAPIDNIKRMLDDDTLYSVLKQILDDIGGIDVIHFQTLEGLSLNVLKLKEEYPNIRVIYSIHNYTLFCPNVQLWTVSNTNCYKCNNHECERCIAKYSFPKTAAIKRMRRTKLYNNKFLYNLYRAFNVFVRTFFKFKRISTKDAELANSYSKKAVEYVNKYCDEILSVSNRVLEIAVYFGIDRNKIKNVYIGSNEVKKNEAINIKRKDSEVFEITYMGYMKKEKGFDFMINALNRLDTSYSKKIRVVFAAKMDNPFKLLRIFLLKFKYNSVKYYNGYKHSEIGTILKDTSVGIVPVLWEDNLPQVAIEYIANGVPILTSDCGGAHELINNNSFIFEGDNIEDFCSHLKKIIDNRGIIDRFILDAKPSVSMEEHLDELVKIYKGIG